MPMGRWGRAQALGTAPIHAAEAQRDAQRNTSSLWWLQSKTWTLNIHTCTSWSCYLKGSIGNFGTLRSWNILAIDYYKCFPKLRNASLSLLRTFFLYRSDHSAGSSLLKERTSAKCSTAEAWWLGESKALKKGKSGKRRKHNQSSF